MTVVARLQVARESLIRRCCFAARSAASQHYRKAFDGWCAVWSVAFRMGWCWGSTVWSSALWTTSTSRQQRASVISQDLGINMGRLTWIKPAEGAVTQTVPAT